MHFATPIPWWLGLPVAAGILALAVWSYRRPLAPLTRLQRGVLISLRALSLLAVFVFVCRPVLLLPPATSGDVVVPVLVDVSRSMRITDAEGAPRLTRAAAIARDARTALSASATIDVFAFSDQMTPASVEGLTPHGPTTLISSALDAVRARYRGRRVAGIVVLSDGGETGPVGARQTAVAGPPVFTVGIGSLEGLPDREVTELTAGDPRLDEASTDLHVTAVSRGFGRDGFQLRVLANGQVVDTRRVVPLADGSPVDQTITVFPDPHRATLYTAEIVPDAGESIAENNQRSMVVSPAGRRRRLLALAGAPGYEHSFLMRALQQDPGLEVDSVVRKGKNDQNQDTFLVQAGGGRAAALTSGFPSTREALFDYDAIIIANIEGDFFSRAQLEMTADFVDVRGGGLLVLGGRSFERRGLLGTPLEPVLPVELTDRRGGALRAAGEEGPSAPDRLALTEEGARHPVMRLGASADQSRTLWATLPPLASSAAVGGPRPGASVLAITAPPSGGVLPVVAVQRYGRGRSMIFAGEASWRWRMLQPSADRRYDFFWRQAARWLSSDAPDPVAMTLPPSANAGAPLALDIDVRDRAFAPVEGATVDATLTFPGGTIAPLALRPSGSGRFSASGEVGAAGLYRVQVAARRDGATLGTEDRWFYAGDNDAEFADPRLNEGLLRRLARESGGRYVRAADVSLVVADLARAVPQNEAPQRRDLWHEPWAFALVILLLSSEWLVRRIWGLR